MRTRPVSGCLLILALLASACPPAQAAPPTTAAALDAGFVKMEVPQKVRAYEAFPVSITMKNTGSETWGEGISLFAQDPAGNETWGTTYIILGQGRKILPGQEAAFRSYLKAPAKPGTYAFVWRTGSRSGPFGEASQRKMIVVEPRDGEPETWPATRPAKQAPDGKRVLTFADFEYAGSFKVPPKVDGKDSIFAAGGLSLRKMPDGARRLFLSYGPVFEVEIPPLVKLAGGDHSPLKTAEVKRVWGPLSVKGADGKAISANAGFWWEEAAGLLYWSSYHGYYTGPARPVLAASKLADDGTVTHLGPWRAPVSHYKSYWGGVIPLPKDFADKHFGGRRIGIGFGGYYSICGSTSQGPALAAIATPDPAKGELDVLELLCMPWGKHGGAPRDGNYLLVGKGWGGDQPVSPDKGSWTMEDWVRAGVFVDLPEAHVYVAFAQLGTGRMGYDYGKITSAGESDWWYLYDPADLIAAAAGKIKPWDVMPHSRTQVTYPPAAKDPKNRNAPVCGACFDEEARLLYVYKPFCVDNRFPCVHVYRVKRR